MTSNIRRLAYVSCPRPGLPAAEVTRIVVAARENNRRLQLGGVLVFTGTDFAQVIEGQPGAVEALWQRIRIDPRHRDITLLLDETDISPWFSEWRMGYLSDAGLAQQFSDWRALDQTLVADERALLQQLFAAADTL